MLVPAPTLSDAVFKFLEDFIPKEHWIPTSSSLPEGIKWRHAQWAAHALSETATHWARGNWPQWKLVVKHLAVTTSGLLVVALSVENHCTNISCYHLGFHGQEKRRNRTGENIYCKNVVLHFTHFVQDTHIRPSSAAHASGVGSRQPAVLPEWVQRHGAELQFSVTEWAGGIFTRYVWLCFVLLLKLHGVRGTPPLVSFATSWLDEGVCPPSNGWLCKIPTSLKVYNNTFKI